MNKTIWSIIAAATGAAAFAAWLFAIWSEQQFEWAMTAMLLTVTTLIASIRSSVTYD